MRGITPKYNIDLNWLHVVGHKLTGFEKVGTGGKTFRARCIYCGDSKKDKKAKRLYFYTKKHSLNFDCKNCGEHGSFWTFMRTAMPSDFEDYKKDQIKSILLDKTNVIKSVPEPKREEGKKSSSGVRLTGVIPLNDCGDDHEAIRYMIGRGFSRREMSQLYYSEDFHITASAMSPEQLSENFAHEPRIVIPFYDKDGNVEMMQGRSIKKNETGLRYITIKTGDDVEKLFGRNFVDVSKTSYCVEGPLDSLFVENCYAVCDANLSRSPADVLIWDNQPRNADVVKYIESAIESGRKVVIWPTSPDQKEDINDIINAGFSPSELMYIIKHRTFSGLKAKLELQKWRKV